MYGYLPTIGGKTAFPVGGSDISVDPSVLLGNLKFTFMGAFDVHNGPWGAFTDVIYLDVGGSKSQTRDFTIGNVGLPAGVAANLQIDVKAWVWTLAAEYRVVENPRLKMDMLLGTRYLSLDQTLTWNISGNLGPIAPENRTGSSEAGGPLWDGIVGVRGTFSFGAGGKWSVPFYLDGGAGDSNQTFQAAAGLGYSFRWGEVSAMWRYLDYDLSGKFVQRVSFNGPLIGATFRW